MGGRRRLAPSACSADVSVAALAAMGGVFAVAAVAVLAIPLLVLATGLVAYPLSFLVQMVSVDAGFRLAAAYADMVRYAFSPADVADGDSATRDALSDARVHRAGVSAVRPSAVDRAIHPSFGETAVAGAKAGRRTRAAIAIEADGGRASSVRRGAPTRDCAIFAPRCGSCFAEQPRRKSRRRPS